MPISASYTWRQSASRIWIDINLRGGRSSVLDTFVSSCYIKINHPPFLTTIDLFGEIDDDTVSLIFDGDKLTIEAAKKIGVVEGETTPTPSSTSSSSSAKPWDDLAIKQTTQGGGSGNGGTSTGMTKAEIATRRTASIDARLAKDAKIAESQSNITKETARQSVRAQMDVEDKQRRLLETAKDDQKKAAEAEVFAALAKLAAEEDETSSSSKPAKIDARSTTSSTLTSSSFPSSSSAAAAAPLATNKHTSSSTSSSSNRIVDENDFSPHALPPPRNGAGLGRDTQAVKLTFTGRAFPTPLRESKRKEEEDWLARNYVKLQQQRTKQLNLKDGPPVPFVEKDPTWLKSKGDDFFRLGDYASAINAYTAALVSDPNSIPCLLNRAACYLQRGTPTSCFEDCTAALEALRVAEEIAGSTTAASNTKNMKSPLSSNTAAQQQEAQRQQRAQQRARALARKMAAFVMDGKYVQALKDAKILAQDDETLEETCTKLQSMVDAATEKERGDKLAATVSTSETIIVTNLSAETEAALAHYAAAIEKEPGYLVARLNRSALYLKISKHALALEDCRAIMEALEGAGSVADKEKEISPLPLKGSPLYAQVEQRATVRMRECEKTLGLTDAQIAATVSAATNAAAVSTTA